LPCPGFVGGGRHFERMPQGRLSLNESTWRDQRGPNPTVFLEDPFVILGSMEEAEMRFDGGGIFCRKNPESFSRIQNGRFVYPPEEISIVFQPSIVRCEKCFIVAGIFRDGRWGEPTEI